MTKFSSLPDHISLLLGRFSFVFGILLFLAGLGKTLYNLPDFAISDLAMSIFGLLVATVLSRKSFTGLMQRLSTPKGERLLFLISLIVCLTIIITKFVTGGSDFYENFLGENSVVEWLTALFLLLSAYLALVTGVSKGSPYPKWMLLAFASILFVAFMEELAWGQMMFGWDTPENFRSLNAQGETTLHNIHGIHDLISPALLLFSSASAGVSLTKKRPNIPWLKNNLWDFSKGLFPMFFLAAIICAVVVFVPGTKFLGRVNQDIEWAEFLISFSIFMHSLSLIANPPKETNN
ncbi:hypothetical protein [Synechococcus sp. MU1642]|uniref:hypothetical protein n=1 Tax=Synechococcus sp. MU1642 TaxID=2508348 RepID=UPI001CF86BCE|nr:hypothetical protein [Synechococcus sp. MU1642]MCB4408165.1 hypothetical protein [Synechococcus sp. MU1642]